MRTKKKWLLRLGAFLLLGLLLALKTMKDAGEFKNLPFHFSGSCKVITKKGLLSSEDITIHPQTGMAFISSDERRLHLRRKPGIQGGIWGYDLKSKKPKLVLLTSSFKKELRPHGISLWIGKGGATSLFVINHPKGKHM